MSGRPHRPARISRRRVLFGSLALGCLGLGCDVRGGGGGAAPAVLRGLSLVDQDGRPVRPEWLSGRIVLLSFLFTRCPEACPRLTRTLARARAALPGGLQRRVRFLSVSVDPDNDTPLALKRFAVKHGARADDWRFVRPEPKGLEALSKRLTVYDPRSAPSPAAHSLALYLFDAAGRFAQRYDGARLDPHHLAREIAALDALSKRS